MYLIGLDVGTSGCKSVLFSFDGRVVESAYEEYEIENPKKGQYELNPHTVWEVVQRVIRKTTRNVKGKDIYGICVSSFGESAIPIGKDGKELANSILYTDQRGTDQADAIRGLLGANKIMKLTGQPVHPMFTVNKIAWIKQNQPELYNDTWKFMLFGDYITYKLSGTAAISYSLASRTMAYNPLKKQWESEITDALQLRSGNDMFSSLCPSGTSIGTVKKEVADQLGLSTQTEVVTGGHDQACAALGGGVIDNGYAVDGIGSVECITPAYEETVLTEEMLECNFNCSPHVVQNRYLTYAFNFTGGSILRWYRDTFLQQLKRDTKEQGKSVYQILDEQVYKEPTNLIVFPHFAGTGTPHMDDAYRGAIMGLTFDTSSAEIYKALLEGVNFEMLYNLETLFEKGIDVHTLRAVGGGAKSEIWMQIKADILGRKVEVLENSEAGALGAAILAGYGIRQFSSLQDAVNNLVKVKKVYEPNKRNNEIYLEKYKRYKNLYDIIGVF